jgi:hypothetical protein
MHVVTLAAPVIGDAEAFFGWTVEPKSTLYRETSFRLRFPPEVDLDGVPQGLWWRVAFICLHSHWPLLRPCEIRLPVRLNDGEKEFWLRLLDAEVATLEAYADSSDTARSIQILDEGPPLEALTPFATYGQVAAAFSSGKDSLTQAGLLTELGERPILVTTTAPGGGHDEHGTARRRQVLGEIARRRPVELVEVESDLRRTWDNDFPAGRYPAAVNELTDTFLYFAATLVVGAARGASHLFLASEAEVQENALRDGAIVQHLHFMYSAVTQRALTALLRPTGARYGSLTYPLHHFQVQRLLATRYPDLRDLQYSCYELASDEAACGRCGECRMAALDLMVLDIAPAEIGIDVTRVVDELGTWRERQVARSGVGGEVFRPAPARAVSALRFAHTTRCLSALPAERVARLGADDFARLGEEACELLEAWERLRAQALSDAIETEPGYRAGFLEFVDEEFRDRVAAIFDEHFARAQPASYLGVLSRSRQLSDWIAAPLQGTGA